MTYQVVVTGLGAVNPLGSNLNQTWHGITEGRSGISKISVFDASDQRCQIAGQINDYKPYRNLSIKNVRKIDRFTHFAISAAHEAIANAGLEITDDIAFQTGVSLGVGIGGQPTIEKFHTVLQDKGPYKISPFLLPMAISNMASGQLSMVFNTKGYNAVTASACASSNHAIGNAVRLIQCGDAKVMFAGGAESTITPLSIAGFSAMRALSLRNDDPKSASRPYDADRDGFVLSEGSAILILEELEFAKKRGATIYAEIKGYGFSSDSYHITKPSIEDPAYAMKAALKDAKMNNDEIDYINTHGTSTPAGDLNEIFAIKKAFGRCAYNLSLSSTKSMTGHLLGAAGAIESVIAIKAINNNFVPPTINVENLDEKCDLDITPNTGKEKQINNVLSNGFGFGGTNACLIFASYKG